MSRRQRIVLAGALVLVVGLFALAVSAGRGAGPADLSGPPGGVVGWLGRLAAPAPVAGDDLAAGCPVTRDRYTVAGSCRLSVRPGGDGLRILHLRAVDAVTVTAPVPSRDGTATSTVRAGADVRVAVRGGAEVTVACQGAPSCAVELVREA